MNLNPQWIVDCLNAPGPNLKNINECLIFIVNTLWKLKAITLKERNHWRRQLTEKKRK